MKRRDFITLMGGTAIAWTLAANAQQLATRPVRIGILTPAGNLASPLFRAFREGLRTLGYIEDRTVELVFHSARGDNAQLPDLARELVRLPVDVIVTDGTAASLAAKEVTTTVPIVMAVVTDPVATGLAASFAHPGGNVTGFAFFSTELSAKRLELLKELIPVVQRVGLLWNSANPGGGRSQVESIKNAARSLGIALELGEATNHDEISVALDDLKERGASALVVVAEVLFWNERSLIVDRTAAKRLPAVYLEREYVDAGGLLAYGPDLSDNFRRCAGYVDRILKGAKPADLPIEQPTKFELIINLKTAKTIGLTVPATLLARADAVVE
jgi:putative ABC transport system substrate-binding protein